MASFRINSTKITARGGRVKPGAALEVPWSITGRAPGTIEVLNRSADTLYQVRCALAGGGLLGLSLPQQVEAGERLSLAVRGIAAEQAASAADGLLVLRWFTPAGQELLWPIAIA